MGRKLAKAVAVLGPDGIAHTFKPGDEAPDWLEEKVTNPAVWGDDVEEVEPRSVPTSELESEPDRESEEERAQRETRSVPTSDVEQGQEQAGEYNPEAGPPPKGGQGATRDAWVAYAEANDIGVADSMSRDDIIAACDLAEVPTE